MWRGSFLTTGESFLKPETRGSQQQAWTPKSSPVFRQRAGGGRGRRGGRRGERSMSSSHFLPPPFVLEPLQTPSQHQHPNARRALDRKPFHC
ncbi:hypothetical protein ACOMHN_024790 [Nucella lapillus]